MFLPAATKLWPRYYFYRCLSVHRGGGCLPQCMLGCHTPPRMENPPGWRTPPGWSTPRMENPPDGEPPQKQTPAYGPQAASMHPTGMHSCYKRLSRILSTGGVCQHALGRGVSAPLGRHHSQWVGGSWLPSMHPRSHDQGVCIQGGWADLPPPTTTLGYGQ